MRIKKKLLDIVCDKIRFKCYAKYATKWQFLFPMRNVAKDPRSEVIRRVVSPLDM